MAGGKTRLKDKFFIKKIPENCLYSICTRLFLSINQMMSLLIEGFYNDKTLFNNVTMFKCNIKFHLITNEQKKNFFYTNISKPDNTDKKKN